MRTVMTKEQRLEKLIKDFQNEKSMPIEKATHFKAYCNAHHLMLNKDIDDKLAFSLNKDFQHYYFIVAYSIRLLEANYIKFITIGKIRDFIIKFNKAENTKQINLTKRKVVKAVDKIGYEEQEEERFKL